MYIIYDIETRRVHSFLNRGKNYSTKYGDGNNPNNAIINYISTQVHNNELSLR